MALAALKAKLDAAGGIKHGQPNKSMKEIKAEKKRRESMQSQEDGGIVGVSEYVTPGGPEEDVAETHTIMSRPVIGRKKKRRSKSRSLKFDAQGGIKKDDSVPAGPVNENIEPAPNNVIPDEIMDNEDEKTEAKGDDEEKRAQDEEADREANAQMIAEQLEAERRLKRTAEIAARRKREKEAEERAEAEKLIEQKQLEEDFAEFEEARKRSESETKELNARKELDKKMDEKIDREFEKYGPTKEVQEAQLNELDALAVLFGGPAPSGPEPDDLGPSIDSPGPLEKMASKPMKFPVPPSYSPPPKPDDDGADGFVTPPSIDKRKSRSNGRVSIDSYENDREEDDREKSPEITPLQKARGIDHASAMALSNQEKPVIRQISRKSTDSFISPRSEIAKIAKQHRDIKARMSNLSLNESDFDNELFPVVWQSYSATNKAWTTYAKSGEIENRYQNSKSSAFIGRDAKKRRVTVHFLGSKKFIQKVKGSKSTRKVRRLNRFTTVVTEVIGGGDKGWALLKRPVDQPQPKKKGKKRGEIIVRLHELSPKIIENGGLEEGMEVSFGLVQSNEGRIIACDVKIESENDKKPDSKSSASESAPNGLKRSQSVDSSHDKPESPKKGELPKDPLPLAASKSDPIPGVEEETPGDIDLKESDDDDDAGSVVQEKEENAEESAHESNPPSSPPSPSKETGNQKDNEEEKAPTIETKDGPSSSSPVPEKKIIQPFSNPNIHPFFLKHQWIGQIKSLIDSSSAKSGWIHKPSLPNPVYFDHRHVINSKKGSSGNFGIKKSILNPDDWVWFKIGFWKSFDIKSPWNEMNLHDGIIAYDVVKIGSLEEIFEKKADPSKSAALMPDLGMDDDYDESIKNGNANDDPDDSSDFRCGEIYVCPKAGANGHGWLYHEPSNDMHRIPYDVNRLNLASQRGNLVNFEVNDANEAILLKKFPGILKSHYFKKYMIESSHMSRLTNIPAYLKGSSVDIQFDLKKQSKDNPQNLFVCFDRFEWNEDMTDFDLILKRCKACVGDAISEMAGSKKAVKKCIYFGIKEEKGMHESTYTVMGQPEWSKQRQIALKDILKSQIRYNLGWEREIKLDFLSVLNDPSEKSSNQKRVKKGFENREMLWEIDGLKVIRFTFDSGAREIDLSLNLREKDDGSLIQTVKKRKVQKKKKEKLNEDDLVTDDDESSSSNDESEESGSFGFMYDEMKGQFKEHVKNAANHPKIDMIDPKWVQRTFNNNEKVVEKTIDMYKDFLANLVDRTEIEKVFECGLCTEETKESECAQFSCGHVYCHICVQEEAKEIIEDGEWPKCDVDGCGKKIPRDVLIKFFSASDLDECV